MWLTTTRILKFVACAEIVPRVVVQCSKCLKLVQKCGTNNGERKKKMSFALVSLKGKNVPVSGVAKSKNVAASVSVRKKKWHCIAGVRLRSVSVDEGWRGDGFRGVHRNKGMWGMQRKEGGLKMCHSIIASPLETDLWQITIQ